MGRLDDVYNGDVVEVSDTQKNGFPDMSHQLFHEGPRRVLQIDSGVGRSAQLKQRHTQGKLFGPGVPYDGPLFFQSRDDAMDGALADPQLPGQVAECQAVRDPGNEAQNVKGFFNYRCFVIFGHCSSS